MSESIPQMGPGELQDGGTNSDDVMSAPSALPPADVEQGAGNTTVAGPPIPPALGMSSTAPALPATGVAAEGGVSAWQNNKRITSLWSINEDRNAWVGVAGIGWKKLANNSSSAIVALTMLGAHAREKGSVVNYREESDGMIREMYVW